MFLYRIVYINDFAKMTLTITIGSNCYSRSTPFVSEKIGSLNWYKAFLCPCFEFYQVIWIKLRTIDAFNRFNFCFNIDCIQLNIVHHDLWSKCSSSMRFIHSYHVFTSNLQNSKAFLFKDANCKRSSITRGILRNAWEIIIINWSKSLPAVKAFSK